MRVLPVFFFLFLSALASCSQSKLTLVNPQSGATAECSVSGYGLLAAGTKPMMNVCVEEAEKKGYLPVDKLTDEQRSALERRGLLPQ